MSRFSSNDWVIAGISLPEPSIVTGQGWVLETQVYADPYSVPKTDITFRLQKGTVHSSNSLPGSLLDILRNSGVPELTALAELADRHADELASLLPPKFVKVAP